MTREMWFRQASPERGGRVANIHADCGLSRRTDPHRLRGDGWFCPAPQHGIHAEILGIRHSVGAVAYALFESPEGFPTGFLRLASNLMMVKVRHT